MFGFASAPGVPVFRGFTTSSITWRFFLGVVLVIFLLLGFHGSKIATNLFKLAKPPAPPNFFKPFFKPLLKSISNTTESSFKESLNTEEANSLKNATFQKLSA